MKRRYTTEDYQSLINTINYYIPNICIGVDVIVGYPNESEKSFNETYTFLEKLNISYLHIFSYSDRVNTLSSKMTSIVKPEEKIKRRKLLQNLSDIKY